MQTTSNTEASSIELSIEEEAVYPRTSGMPDVLFQFAMPSWVRAREKAPNQIAS
jgi:hypothetical protein